jgi:ribosomal protein S8
MNKKLINFLISIKNASLNKKSAVIIPYDKQFIKLLAPLYKTGLILSFKVLHLSLTKTNDNKKIHIKVILRIFHNLALTDKIKILSTPTKRKYLSYNDIVQINSKGNLFFFSTSKGIISQNECLKFKIGGILLFSC